MRTRIAAIVGVALLASPAAVLAQTGILHDAREHAAGVAIAID